jgi:uracil-DNA glycosylase
MTNSENVKIEETWKLALDSEFHQSYMQALGEFLRQEKKAGKQIYPPGSQIFNAFNLTPFDQVKVVILGQDPYHGAGQAHGLCFSVQPDVKLPPSLQNIYKEISQEYGLDFGGNGCLEGWARQGVLLLNAVLTVEHGKAGSHQGKGWEQFTDKVVSLLNEEHEGLVFLLWGSYAQNKGQFIDQQRHLVLQSPHPSPLSAYKGFLGNGHFKRTNDYLTEQGLDPIDWRT